jgi:hypothetical protein
VSKMTFAIAASFVAGALVGVLGVETLNAQQ